MFNVQAVKSPIKVGSGKSLIATKIGKKRVEVIQKSGTSGTFVLTEVKYVPGLFANLFSIGQALKNGFKISNKGCIISLRQGDSVISFDRMLPTERVFVSGVVLKPCVPTLASENTFPQNAAANALERGKRLTLNEAHSLLGHAAIATVKKTAQSYGWIISDLGNGEQEINCQSCTEAKARQANVPKSIRDPSTIPGEWLCMDISSVKKESFGRATFWLLVIDEATDCSWSFFITKKSMTQDKINELVGFINGMGDRKVTFRRCDNAGENTKAEAVLYKFWTEYPGPR
jgi:hypothetical protein